VEDSGHPYSISVVVETPLQSDYDGTGSTWSKIFFPPEPLANLFITPLTIFVASPSLSFPSILMISWLGSLNCSIFSASNQRGTEGV